jgi:hypothetical protein
LEEYFPAQFKNPGSIRGWVAYKDMLLKQAELLLNPSEEAEEAFSAANMKMISLVKSSNIAEKELKYDKDFEKNCIVLSQFVNEPVKEISVREYFSLLEHYNDINKKHGRAKSKV